MVVHRCMTAPVEAPAEVAPAEVVAVATDDKKSVRHVMLNAFL
jgi:hypothetical protein